ncbi:hypothetical protein [Mariprofundus ferrooxydans]|uniref:hypothetical protein n=1 Tax=Mariprofundus ferrooxydans TaxID=314344 RepID=UPI00142F9C15|nr:hypothetical protein [Mariprofundus ferrooxydans]
MIKLLYAFFSGVFVSLLISGCVPHPSTDYVPKPTSSADHSQGHSNKDLFVYRENLEMQISAGTRNNAFVVSLLFNDTKNLPNGFDTSKIILVDKGTGEQYNPTKITYPGPLGFDYFGLASPPKSNTPGVLLDVYFDSEIAKFREIVVKLPLQNYGISEIVFTRVESIEIPQPF